MASIIEVKEYLAYWFQLGKRVVMPKSQKKLLPIPVFERSKYSLVFEEYWQEILTTKEDCYLDGTEQTIKELLTPVWEIINCSRCTLPVPANHGHPYCSLCPCADIPSWPNLELPLPKIPSNDQEHLSHLQFRLQKRIDQEKP